MNKRNNNYWKRTERTRNCSCGRTLKEKKRINYPFGKNSTRLVIKFYKCDSCNKILRPFVKEGHK